MLYHVTYYVRIRNFALRNTLSRNAQIHKIYPHKDRLRVSVSITSVTGMFLGGIRRYSDVNRINLIDIFASHFEW